MSHGSISNALRAALRGAFGLTCTYLGDELFDICASGFVAHHATSVRSLQSYGDDFSVWLARILADQPLVAELARLEWALCSARATGAAAAPAAAMRLVLHPSVRVLALDWNTMDVWRGLRGGEAPPEARPLPQTAYWVVWQCDRIIHYRETAAAEAGALLDFRPGCSASGAFLQAWLAQGLLVQL